MPRDATRSLTSRSLAILLAASTLFVVACGRKEGDAEAPAAVQKSPSPSKGAYEEITVTDGGALEGVVLLEGEAPTPKKVRVIRISDQTVCGTEKVSDVLRVGPAGGVADAVVALDDVRRGKPLSSLPPPPPVDQERCEYRPHVAIYPTGAPLALLNTDPLLHNVHAYAKGGETLFNAAMPRRGMKLTKPLPPGGWVSLKCDVHPWMNGTVWITDHPYVAVTDESGRFAIADVPAGTYTLKAWHPLLSESGQGVEIQKGSTASVTIRLSRGP